jgi:hypothetical protein
MTSTITGSVSHLLRPATGEFLRGGGQTIALAHLDRLVAAARELGIPIEPL